MTVIPEITIADSEWEPVGPEDNPRSRLLATIVLNNEFLHLQAFEVERSSIGEQDTVAPGNDGPDPPLTAIWALLDGDAGGGAMKTWTIAGREYVLLAYPWDA